MKKTVLKGIALLCMLALTLTLTGCTSDADRYSTAKKLIADGEYSQALTAFEKIKDYEDSSRYIDYINAVQLGEEGSFEQAAALLQYNVGALEDSESLLAYYTARLSEQNGDYETARALYEQIPAMKDSGARLDEMNRKIEQQQKAASLIGESVYFGSYPQTAEGSDSTPIEWLVLEAQGDKVLLLSKYGLDTKAYNDEYCAITWEQCSLRAWLNDDFMNRAFTAAEQAAILPTDVDNSREQGCGDWETNGGSNTQDKVFLLSCAEANKLFDVSKGNDSNLLSRTAPTAYALANGALYDSTMLTPEDEPACCWWLRSPGYYQDYAAFVYVDGSLYSANDSQIFGTVRPAMWVSPEAGIF